MMLTIRGSEEEVWFQMGGKSIVAKSCKRHYYSGRKSNGFSKESGVLTFLKTSTKLEIRFAGETAVTWIYEDEEGERCGMRNQLAEIKFVGGETGDAKDAVSVEYRYKIGSAVCMKFYIYFPHFSSSE